MRNKIQKYDLDPVESVVNEGVVYLVDTHRRPAPGVDMEAVYFTEDSSQALAFFKDNPDKEGVERLQKTVGEWHDRIASGPDGETALRSMCCPTDVVRHKDDIGIVLPAWPSVFYFKNDGHSQFFKLKGVEKKASCFCKPVLCMKAVRFDELGKFSGRLRCCLKLARIIDTIHSAGLAHGKISSCSVLLDPVECEVLLTDCYNIFEPGKSVPFVIGTKGFIAPEIVMEQKEPKKAIALHNQETDLHSLAVLIYSILLRRHPLSSSDVGGTDAILHGELTFENNALFIEHPTDTRNRYNWKWVVENSNKDDVNYLYPWCDLDDLPYTKLGPHLSPLVERAFVDGLHNPSARPTAAEWANALEKTIPLNLSIPN